MPKETKLKYASYLSNNSTNTRYSLKKSKAAAGTIMQDDRSSLVLLVDQQESSINCSQSNLPLLKDSKNGRILNPNNSEIIANMPNLPKGRRIKRVKHIRNNRG